jgi:hypothetical protein
MVFKLVQCQANFINNVKWTKTPVTQVNMQTFEERNSKSPRTKVGASREEREAIHCLESVGNSRTTFKTLAKSNKWMAKRTGASITSHNRSTSQVVDIHKTL